MSGIVCTLRGGLQGQATITHAVTLALETSLPVHFLDARAKVVLTGGNGS